MPDWVATGYETYAKRLKSDVRLVLHEINMPKRGKQAVIPKLIEQEGQGMLKAIPKDDYCLALDVNGRSYSTESLAKTLEKWQGMGRNISLLIGGPDGLSQDCLNRADSIWSLSGLTFPHPLVRVIVAEQIYRAWSLTHQHPYHRP